jgi:hypothetical protein
MFDSNASRSRLVHAGAIDERTLGDRLEIADVLTCCAVTFGNSRGSVIPARSGLFDLFQP